VAKVRAVIAIATPGIRDDIVRAAEGLIDVAATRAELDAVLSALDGDNGRIDLAIVDLAALRALVRRARRSKTGPASQSPSAILVLPSGELQDALGLLQLCQGVLFWEHDIDKLRGLLIVTLEGYSGVRPELLPDFTTDRVRAGLIERLTPVERRTLELLGEALSNRAIARELDVADSIAKSLVRAVLTKLRLKNRTEAAVLAARWSGGGAAGPVREAGFSPAQVAS
jgi:DNA-binding NarL/FixJ family response regulator